MTRAAPVRTLVACAWVWSAVVLVAVLLHTRDGVSLALAAVPLGLCLLTSLSLRVHGRLVGLLPVTVGGVTALAAMASFLTSFLAVLPTCALIIGAGVARLTGEN